MNDGRRPPAKWGEALAFYWDNLYTIQDECKLWPYAMASGYGKVQINGKLMGTHQLACLAWNGPPPPHTEAAHGPCHNRLCWNGAHLSWQTRKVQQRHRYRDGTDQVGERNPAAKFTNDQILTLRDESLLPGVTQRQLAKKYQVSEATISRIVHLQAYKIGPV